MNVNLEISIGEFFDKLTILEIKKERIKDASKLVNVNTELDALNELLSGLAFSRADVDIEVSELKTINEKLWVIEDDIRDKESARSVYFTNDRRSDVKREINIKLGSDFIEESIGSINTLSNSSQKNILNSFRRLSNSKATSKALIQRFRRITPS